MCPRLRRPEKWSSASRAESRSVTMRSPLTTSSSRADPVGAAIPYPGDDRAALGDHAALRRSPGHRARGERSHRRGRRQHHGVDAVLLVRHRDILHANPGGPGGTGRPRSRAQVRTGPARCPGRGRRGRTPHADARACLEGRPRTQRPAVRTPQRQPGSRHPADPRQPRRAHPARRLLRHPVRAPPRHLRDQAPLRAAGPRSGRAVRHRAGRPCPVHADPVAGAVRAPRRSSHQHPPLVPARLQGCEPVPAGPYPWCETDRCDRTLRHDRARRGPDHRSERDEGEPLALRIRARRARPGHRVANPCERSEAVRATSRTAGRQPHDHLRLTRLPGRAKELPMSGPAGEAKRRLDLVHLLNSQASTWRAALVAPPVRPSDGLAADSPMGWQGVPWWRHVGVRSLAFFVALGVVWAAVNGLWFLAHLHVGVTWYVPVVFELIPAVAAYVLVVMVLERRQPAIEYAPRRWGGLIPGLALGAILCLVVTGIIWLLGGMTFVGVDPNPPWLSRLISLGLVAGVAEEIVLRGVLFRYVESLLGTWASVAISAVIFGGLHLSNENATLTGAVAIALEAGVMFAVLYALTRSLWVVVGVHAGWNLMQGLGLGIVVSGSSDTGMGFLVSNPTGPEFVSGGGFGIEASVVSVVGWLLVAAYLSWRLVRRDGVVAPAWVRHRRLPGNPVAPSPLI